MDQYKSWPRGITGVKSLPGVPRRLDKYLEAQSSGIIKQMGHIRLRKFSKLEVMGFWGETPHVLLLLCLFPVGDRMWTGWTQFRIYVGCCLKCCLAAEMETQGLLNCIPTEGPTPLSRRRQSVHLPTHKCAGILLKLLDLPSQGTHFWAEKLPIV